MFFNLGCVMGKIGVVANIRAKEGKLEECKNLSS
jgi:hypothetical protein